MFQAVPNYGKYYLIFILNWKAMAIISVLKEPFSQVYLQVDMERALE